MDGTWERAGSVVPALAESRSLSWSRPACVDQHGLAPTIPELTTVAAGSYLRQGRNPHSSQNTEWGIADTPILSQLSAQSWERPWADDSHLRWLHACSAGARAPFGAPPQSGVHRANAGSRNAGQSRWHDAPVPSKFGWCRGVSHGSSGVEMGAGCPG